MPPEETGVDLSEELESIFRDEEEPQSPAEGNGDSAQEPQVDQTKAFAQRLKERTDKAVAEERERMAKEFGYDTYAAFVEDKEKRTIEHHGFKPEDVSPMIDELVKQRLEQDPRMKELEDYRSQRAKEFAQQELKQLQELTGGTITSMDQIPKDVIEDWKQSGSLKSSYLKLHGEELLAQARAGSGKGTTSHLASAPSAPPQPQAERVLTAEERRVWKLFHPDITDEELDKKRVKI